jgi:hypothetical protein
MSSDFVERAKSLTEGGPLNFAGLVVTEAESGGLRLRLAREADVFDIEFSGVRECTISTSEPFAVDAIEISASHPFLWNYGSWSTIFGKAPLPDAPKFFYDFNQLVLDTLSVERDPLDYLFFQTGLPQWREFVYSRSFTLLNAPTRIAQAATELLDRQAAEYAVLEDPERPADSAQLGLFEAKGLGKIVFEGTKLC